MTQTPRICTIGSSNTDLVVRVPRLPEPGETLFGYSFHTGFGGKGANQAVMAALLGGRVTMISKLGRDIFGESTLVNYRDYGVDTEYVLFDAKEPTGTAFIFVNEATGQNSIVVAGGANKTLTGEEVRRASDAITSAHVVLAQCETTLDATVTAFRIGREAGKITVFNPAPAPTNVDEALPFADYVVPNELEAEALVGHKINGDDQMIGAARELQQRGARGVLITLGSRGVLVVDGDKTLQFIAAEQVKAVDTTGAGDAFVGSLGYFLAVGRPIEDAARRACAVATLTVQKMGAMISYPHRGEVMHLLQD